jgi:WhiB family redox-sensing transcriptional regulator
MDMQIEQPRPIQSDWEWQYQAACKGMPTDLFFYSDRERGPRRNRRERQAKAICASCPVIKECRDQALRLAEPYGIWGGLTEDERLIILNKKFNRNTDLIA